MLFLRCSCSYYPFGFGGGAGCFWLTFALFLSTESKVPLFPVSGFRDDSFLGSGFGCGVLGFDMMDFS